MRLKPQGEEESEEGDGYEGAEDGEAGDDEPGGQLLKAANTSGASGAEPSEDIAGNI
jgi:hypothetical protein